MADYVELANSYYRLLRWVETSDADKKNTALRSLERIKRFLDDSNVEVVDLTGQPFSEGWAVKVMKMDESVPDNELVFTKVVKPIIQINGELKQEGEVYVGKLEQAEKKEQVEELVGSVPNEEKGKTTQEDENARKHGASLWLRGLVEKAKKLPASPWKMIATIFGIVALAIIILLACTLGGQSGLRTDVAAVDKKVDELAVVDYRNQLGTTSIVTYEVRNGDNTIIVTQPIGDAIVSTVEVNGVPITIVTNTTTIEGE